MHSVKKGNQWHFGMKCHTGVDAGSGFVHTVKATAANVHDVTMTPQLLSGEEKMVYCDSGYLGAEKREDAVLRNKDGKKIQYKINRRPSQSKNNSARSKGQIKRRKREKSSVRAKVEHVFAVVKGRFQYRKTRFPPGENLLRVQFRHQRVTVGLTVAGSGRLPPPAPQYLG